MMYKNYGCTWRNKDKLRAYARIKWGGISLILYTNLDIPRPLPSLPSTHSLVPQLLGRLLQLSLLLIQQHLLGSRPSALR